MVQNRVFMILAYCHVGPENSLLGVLQDVEQHPWPPTTRCQYHPYSHDNQKRSHTVPSAISWRVGSKTALVVTTGREDHWLLINRRLSKGRNTPKSLKRPLKNKDVSTLCQIPRSANFILSPSLTPMGSQLDVNGSLSAGAFLFFLLKYKHDAWSYSSHLATMRSKLREIQTFQC